MTTFTGQAFRLDPTAAAEALLVLPDGYTLLLPEVAFQFTDSTPRVPAAYFLQGAILRHGEGRVAVFGEAAMFSAQLAGPDKVPMGMNAPDARQNHRFALNVLHWLSGILQPREEGGAGTAEETAALVTGVTRCRRIGAAVALALAGADVFTPYDWTRKTPVQPAPGPDT